MAITMVQSWQCFKEHSGVTDNVTSFFMCLMDLQYGTFLDPIMLLFFNVL